MMSFVSLVFPTEKDYLNKEKFIIVKSFQILGFLTMITSMWYYRDDILWGGDKLGKVADIYKLSVSFCACFLVTIEPLLNFNNYCKLNNEEKKFYKLFQENFRDFGDQKKIRKEILLKLSKICISFVLFYSFCDSRVLIISLRTYQSRNIHFLFTFASIFLFTKIAQVVYQLITIETFLSYLNKILSPIQEELKQADRLKSSVYDRILEEKFLKVFKLYECIQSMTGIFNKSAHEQFVIFQSLKFYLTGDFYWISLVTMHSQIKTIATYGKFKNILGEFP